MYTVLKSKRYHFEIHPCQTQQEQAESHTHNQAIIGSCFLDDVFILFLFNTGRYFIVNNNPQQKASKDKHKKSSTNQSQIIYDGDITHQLQKNSSLLNQSKQSTLYTTPKKLVSKNSLTLLQQMHSKVIFTDCKRIKVNQCIIITRHSQHVYRLKLIKNSISHSNQINQSISTEITTFPGTMISELLSQQMNQQMYNMTIITDIFQFNNASQKISNKNLLNKTSKYDNTGSFFIKNEIVEDKMIYLTVYTKIPQQITLQKQQSNKQIIQNAYINSFYNNQSNSFPQYIITKIQYPLPINEVPTSFVTQISDKNSNQIVIYKQSQDDGVEWEIKIFNFGFQQIAGKELLKKQLERRENIKLIKQGNSSQNAHKNQIQTQNNYNKKIAQYSFIQNLTNIPKPYSIILPNEFTSAIRIQQFLKFTQFQTEKTYMIISINLAFVQQIQIIQQHNLNAFQLNHNQNQQNWNLIMNAPLNQQNQNPLKRNLCWIHACRLVYQQNSKQNFNSFFQRLYCFQLDAARFLKVININYEAQLIYILSLAHQRIEGQLYDNKIDLIDIKTGKSIQKGFCCLKNYSFSPNQKYILDVPYSFSLKQDFFYHIRFLFDKKSLYVFLIQNSKQYFQSYHNVSFVQNMLSLL